MYVSPNALSGFQATNPSLTNAIVLWHADVPDVEGSLLTVEWER